MKIKTLSLTTILGFVGLIVMIHTLGAKASTGAVNCTTAFGEKTFTIEDNRISFQKEDELGVSRAISSLQGDSVRTHKKNLGFTKTLYINGQKHSISIQNANAFSDVNDYLSITSSQGHKMTYPISCHSV